MKQRGTNGKDEEIKKKEADKMRIKRIIGTRGIKNEQKNTIRRCKSKKENKKKSFLLYMPDIRFSCNFSLKKRIHY